MTWGWILAGVLVILGSVLAMAESSLTRMTRVRALALESEGRRNATTLVRIESDPPRYLNSIYLSVNIVQTVQSGDIDIVIRSKDGTLHQGRSVFTIEFRRPGSAALVDVGAVHASANMTMPGMAMSGGLEVSPTGVPGRYDASAEFDQSPKRKVRMAV